MQDETACHSNNGAFTDDECLRTVTLKSLQDCLAAKGKQLQPQQKTCEDVTMNATHLLQKEQVRMVSLVEELVYHKYSIVRTLDALLSELLSVQEDFVTVYVTRETNSSLHKE